LTNRTMKIKRRYTSNPASAVRQDFSRFIILLS